MAAEPVHIKRILLLAPTLEARGLSECTLNLAHELERMEVEVGVFCAPGPMLELLPEEAITVRAFEHLENPGMHFAEQKRLLDAVAEFGPQLIHGQSFIMAPALRLLRKNQPVPMVLTLHWLPRDCRGLRKLAQTLEGLVASTQSLREEMVNECGVDKQKVRVIHNGVNVAEVDARGMPPIFRSDVPVVGCLGPMEEKRGHKLFLKAAARLVADGAEAQFVLAGEGEELQGLRRLTEKLGLQRLVTMATDLVSYEDVLAAVDIVVQSAQVNVSGFSILEAMAAGRPVVAYNTGTACEMIQDGRNGLLVPKGDVDALARAITRLVADHDAARSIAEEARRVVRENFNVRTMAMDTVHFYTEILSSPPPGAS